LSIVLAQSVIVKKWFSAYHMAMLTFDQFKLPLGGTWARSSEKLGEKLFATKAARLS